MKTCKTKNQSNPHAPATTRSGPGTPPTSPAKPKTITARKHTDQSFDNTLLGEPWPHAGEEGPPPVGIGKVQPRPPEGWIGPRIKVAPGIPRPDPNSPTWEHVLAFAYAMEYKLSKNRRKGDSAAWRSDHPSVLMDRIDNEIEELSNALGDWFEADFDEPDQGPKVLLEAADVANFCMMLADRVNFRRPE